MNLIVPTDLWEDISSNVFPKTGRDVLQYRDFIIRPWEPRDRSAVSDLVRTVLTEYGLGFEPDQTDRDALQVEEAYWRTGGEFWVVEHQGKIVGSGGFHPTHLGSGGVELRKMFLLPEVRGLGLGRYLLKNLEVAAARRGFQQMWLETATVLKEAVRLYEQSGYRIPANASVQVSRCDRIYVKDLVPPEPAPE
ncbi:MAG: GNAT family N-acetyltransferase [Synechococcales bacterium]|nr:GNAT family N-acetyltransferase [Synechococcales bacterium]